MLEVMDENHDGKVSYFEFAKHVSATAGTKAIDDQNHWAFGIFEQMRRTLQMRNMSLEQAFGVSNLPHGKALIPVNTFRQGLGQMNIVLYGNQEQELGNLLDV